MVSPLLRTYIHLWDAGNEARGASFVVAETPMGNQEGTCCRGPGPHCNRVCSVCSHRGCGDGAVEVLCQSPVRIATRKEIETNPRRRNLSVFEYRKESLFVTLHKK